MRTFRDSLTAVVCVVGCVAIQACAKERQGWSNDYFPLAVGNSWSYRCSVEGSAQDGKSLRIKKEIKGGGIVYYLAELTVGHDPKPLVYFLSVDQDGTVWQSPEPSTAQREALVGRKLDIGSRYGSWLVGGKERTRIPALASVETLRLENFSIDAEDITEKKRVEWLAKYYVSGIGLVAEADGLGGNCELVTYRVGTMSPTNPVP
jgi:hypothetical protein